MSRILKVYDKDIFKITDHFIKVEFPFSVPKSYVSNDNGDVNGDVKAVLDILRKDPRITAKKLSEKVSVSPRKISRIIRLLREKGKITRIGSDKKGYWEIKE